MAASAVAASKLLNTRNSALHSLIRRLHLHPSSAAIATSKNPFPSTSSQSLYSFLLNKFCVESHGYSSIAVLPKWRSGYSLIQSEGGRSYATKGDHDYEDVEESDDDDDDDIENYSGSDFDDEDEYEDPDQDPDSRNDRTSPLKLSLSLGAGC